MAHDELPGGKAAADDGLTGGLRAAKAWNPKCLKGSGLSSRIELRLYRYPL
jgi:hypothetical protein